MQDNSSSLLMSSVERTARMEEALRHALERIKSFSDRIHNLTTHMTATDTRVSQLEADLRRALETVAEYRPIVEAAKRSEIRKGIIKDALNWGGVLLILYMAFTGKKSWLEGFGALVKIFGAS